MIAALVTESFLAWAKVSCGAITQAKYKAHHLELSLKRGLGQGIFIGLASALVDEPLDLGVDRFHQVAFDSLLETRDGRVGLEHVVDDFIDDGHGGCGNSMLDGLVNHSGDHVITHSVSELFFLVHASRISNDSISGCPGTYFARCARVVAVARQYGMKKSCSARIVVDASEVVGITGCGIR